MMENFASRLEKLLKEELPGQLSHQKMMSYKRPAVKEVIQKKAYRESAVLVLFYPLNEEPYVIFMLRPVYDGVHSGQVCFPGGRREEEDLNLWHTALREAREELNIESDKVKVIGELSRIFVPPSNFVIQPIVGYSNERPDFIPEETEVEMIIEVPVRELKNSQNLQRAKVTVQDNVELEVPGFVFNDHLVWGATSMIVMELLDVLEKLEP